MQGLGLIPWFDTFSTRVSYVKHWRRLGCGIITDYLFLIGHSPRVVGFALNNYVILVIDMASVEAQALTPILCPPPDAIDTLSMSLTFQTKRSSAYYGEVVWTHEQWAEMTSSVRHDLTPMDSQQVLRNTLVASSVDSITLRILSLRTCSIHDVAGARFQRESCCARFS